MDYDESKLVPLLLQMLEQGKLPDTLYCYKSINEYTLDIFADSAFWFSSPDNFNDPFDCKVYPSVDSAIERVMKRTGSNFRGDEVRKNITEENLTKAVDSVMQRVGILCLTPHADNILMWSHYADNHKGICIELNVRACPELFVYPIKVNYTKDYPVFDLGDTNLIYATKFESWSYEEEVRILKKKAGKHHFNPRCVKSVIFGCRISEESKRILKAVVDGNGQMEHMVYKQAVMDDRMFKLNIHHL